MKEASQVATHVGGQFSPHQVQCLDAVSTFIDHGDACVTGVLLHAVIVNIAMAAVYLYCHLRRVVANF